MKKLSDLLDDGGYLIPHDHFEVSKTLHLDNYYFAKKYLQDSVNIDRIAKLLTTSILDNLSDLGDTTIVSYGNYSSLYLSKIVKLLQDKGHSNINYAIVDWDRSDYSFSFKPTLKKNIVIVLSITCTFNRYFHLVKYFLEKYPEHKVAERFFCAILILDNEITKQIADIEDGELLEISRQPATVKRLYQPYRWWSISKTQVIFEESQQRGPREEVFFVEHFSAKIFAAEECELCFPLLNGVRDQDALKEKPLFQPLPNDSLNIIFELPQYANELYGAPIISFEQAFGPHDGEPVHLYGHLEQHHNTYLNYIRRDIFYRKNKQRILDFFRDRLSEFRAEHVDEEIIIITPDHFFTSSFLDDLVDHKILGQNHIKVIPYQPFSEFLENFIHLYKDIIAKAKTVIYLDEVIAGGKTFKLISDYLKNAQLESTPEKSEFVNGFDYFFTLIDRSSKYAKEEIKRKLAANSNANAKESFIAFTKLNVPQIETSHVGNPINERAHALELIFNQSHLDALKLFVGGEIFKGSERSAEEILTEYNRPNNLKYFPFIASEEQFNFYKDRYTFSQRNLLKLRLFHDISTWLADKTKFDETVRIALYEELLSYPKLNAYFNISQADQYAQGRDIFLEQEMISELILKVLARPPFRYYKSIYETMFAFNNRELFDRLEEIKNADITQKRSGKAQFAKINFEHFRKLKTHIKRTIELNANFILSDYFLRKLKQYFVHEAAIVKVYEKQQERFKNLDTELAKRIRENLNFQGQQVIKFKYFLLYCYKELIVKNPARSIVLENLLNQPNLLPDWYDIPSEHGSAQSFRRLLSDSFYQLRRILLAENVYFLNELIAHQLSHNQFVESILKGSSGDWQPGSFNVGMFNTLLLDLTTTGSEGSAEIYNQLFAFLHIAVNDKGLLDKVGQLIESGADGHHAIHSIKEEIILRYYFYEYFNRSSNESEIAKSVKLFLSKSESCNDALMNEHIRFSVRSMLFTLSLISNYKSARQQQPAISTDHFISEIKRILHSATNIIGKGLNFVFFVEYRDRRGPADIDNIFAISSREQGENNNIKLDPDGLIYQMLYGLQDYPDGNMQTFLAIAKTEQNILSLKDHYYTLDKGSSAEGKKITVSEALLLDYHSDITGSLNIENAKMLLLFRLATIKQKDKHHPFKSRGQAVFAICSDETPTVTSFKEFANMEKMRLMLLIKDQLLDYLQKQFDSDAFISVLEDRKVADFRKGLNHGIYNYMLALHQYQAGLLKDTASLAQNNGANLNAYRIRQNTIMGNTVINAIIGQVHATNKGQLEMLAVDPALIKEKILFLFNDPDLGNKSVSKDQVILPDNYPATLPYGIYNVIIPELIINMKKYSPDMGEKSLSIQYVSEQFIFTNQIGYETIKSETKQHGGYAMCNQILAQLGLQELRKDEASSKNGLFVVTLSLNKT